MLTRMLASTAARLGGRTALVWREGSLTWQALARLVRARARVLGERGVGSSRAVALRLPNGPGFVIDLFAIAARGAVAIPLSPQLRDEEVAQCLRGCDVADVIEDDEAAATERLTADAPDAVAPTPAPPHTGDVLHGFSSGSTGAPKRVVRTQSNLVHEAEHFTAAVGLGPEDVIFGVVPFHHAHGLANCVLAAVRSGARLVLEPSFDPRRAIATIEREGVTVLPGVPFIFRMLAEVRTDTATRLDGLRLCFSAGAPLPARIFEAFDKRFGIPVRQLYGCTEAGSLTLNLDPDAAGTAASVGRPLGDVEVAIVDEDGRPRAPGEVGEIVVASPALGRSDAPSGCFRDGRFFTGDLGRLDEAGRLFVTGRRKLFVSTPAGKVDPFEVERCIAGHPGVREVVVVGASARGGDELVKAVVVPRAPFAPGDGEARRALRREIVAHCRQHLAAFKVPRQVEMRDAIPRSPLGKVLRKDLV